MTINELFLEAEADTKHKTGWFGDTGIEWYTKRDGSGQRVIKYRHVVAVTKPGSYRDRRVKNELFPYSPEGLKAAILFAETH